MYPAVINKPWGVLCFALIVLVNSAGWCQDKKGGEDLDKAFDQKIKAQSTKDLDDVVSLCKSALEKGLDEEGTVQAKQLAASALFEHADQLGQRIFTAGEQDPRWRMYRTQALKRLDEATEFQPDMVQAFLMIARLNLLPGGNQDKAKKAIDSAIEFSEDDDAEKSKALFMRAALTEDNDQRIADLNKAIEIDPGNMDAVRVRAAYYLQNNDTEKAIADINSWIGAGEVNTGKYMEVVRSLMSMGDKFDEKLQQAAIQIVDKAIENDPDNTVPLTVRAQINILREKMDEAAEDVSRAIKLDNKNIGALLLRASIYSDQEKLDEALADINEVLKIEPLLVQGIQMRGTILSQQEKFGEAIEDIQLLADNDRSNQFLQRQLAMLYNANDQPSRAIKVYDKLLELNSEDQWKDKSNSKKIVFIARRAAVLRGRGDARLSTGEHKEAIADYNEALELGDELKKIEEEEGATELTKPDDGVLNNLAWVLATSPTDDVRDGERAIKLATQAAEITEFKQAHILSTLASGYAETGDFENAIKWIEKAIEINREEGEKQQSKRNDEQRESLQKEHESYQRKEPWRELQNVEAEQKAAELEKTENQSDKDSDSDDSKKDKSDDGSGKKSDEGDNGKIDN